MKSKKIYPILITLIVAGVSSLFFNITKIKETSNIIDPATFCKNIETTNQGIGKLFQVENKLLTIQTFDQYDSTGELSCTYKQYIEPEPITIDFSCRGGIFTITDGWWKVRSRCRDFRPRQIKCNKFSKNFDQDITQINLTRFSAGDEVYGFDLSENKSFRDTNGNPKVIVGSSEISSISPTAHNRGEGSTSVFDMLINKNNNPIVQNPLAMSAAICSIVNNGAMDVPYFCLQRPNHRSCYGMLGHSFVDFPNSYFATHEGDWTQSDPGYAGLNTFPEINDSTWNHFDFTNFSKSGKLEFSVGVRFNPRVNIGTFNQLQHQTLQSFHPDNPDRLPTIVSDNYNVISSYYNQSAINEIQRMRDSQQRGIPQYYYDHLIRTFRGYGAELEKLRYKNKDVFDPTSTHQFQRFCENGCRNLILTSHENCSKNFVNSAPNDTEVHCFPKHLNISINTNSPSVSGVFSIQGYDTVKIQDLVIKVTSNNKNAQLKGIIKSGEPYNIDDYLDYMIPRNSYVFEDGEIISLSSYSNVDENNTFLTKYGIHSFNHLLYNYDLDNYNYALSTIKPWIAKEGFYDFVQLFAMSVRLDKSINAKKPIPISCYNQNLIEFNSDIDFSSCSDMNVYSDRMSCQLLVFRKECSKEYMFSSYLGNILGDVDRIKLDIFQTPKVVFDIKENDKLLVSDILLKTTASAGFSSKARKNIFHGNNFQGISLEELEMSGFPISNPEIGVSTDNLNTSNLNEIYFAPSFVVVSNPEGHIRFDNDRISNDKNLSYENQTPQLYNLCKSLNGTEVNPTYCNPTYNFRLIDQETFSGEEYFSPFYYSDITPEHNARKDGILFNHYSSDVYLKNFNPSLTPSFLSAFDENPSNPIIYNSNVPGDSYRKVSSINAQTQCVSNIDCGEDSYCYNDTTSYPNGICLNGNIRRHYLIASNNTFANHSFSTINFNNGINKFINHEFITTDGINALIFNNILKNSQSDMYDLNFRSTHYRSEWNKSLIQVIERNILTNGRFAKVTGEGNPESKMRFSNNIYHNVRVGGYHALFKPFYLNNTFIISDWTKVFNDQQDNFVNMEYLKPYGVRHTFFNNLFIKKKTSNKNYLMVANNTRPKQYSFDYNFSQNLYFAYFGNWLESRSQNENDIDLDWSNLLNHPTIGQNYNLNNESNGCFGAYLFGGGEENVIPEEDGSCPEFTPSIEDFQFFYGSFENMKFLAGDTDENNFGKIKLIEGQGNQSGFKLIGHRSDLFEVNPETNKVPKNKYRLDFIVQDCFGLDNISSNDQIAPTSFSQVVDDYLGVYRCVTGDNKSLFFADEHHLTEAEDIMDYLDESFVTNDEQVYIKDLKNYISGHYKCGEIMTTASKNKTPTVFVFSSGLSVLRDFEGIYRGVTSTSGAFDTKCE